MPSTSAENAVFGFGGQTGRGTLATTWYKHKGVAADIAARQSMSPIADEFGGGYHTTGVYKEMAFGAGTAALQGRLQNVLGWLIYATVGSLSVTETDTPVAGMYRHRFVPPAACASFPWLSIRRKIPGNTTDDDSADVLQDCRVVSARFAMAGGGLLTEQFGFVGRIPYLQANAEVDAWSWSNASFDAPTGIPNAADSEVYYNDALTSASSVVIDILNRTSQPRAEMIIGSGYPDDFVVSHQDVSVTIVKKWQDWSLYRAIFNNDEAKVGDYYEWSSTPKQAPARIRAKTAAYATGTTPWQLHFYFPSLTWDASPIGLAGGGFVTQTLTGILEEQASAPHFVVDLENLTTAYSWPS